MDIEECGAFFVFLRARTYNHPSHVRFRKAGYLAIDRICDYYYSIQDRPVCSQVRSPIGITVAVSSYFITFRWNPDILERLSQVRCKVDLPMSRLTGFQLLPRSRARILRESRMIIRNSLFQVSVADC